MIAMFNVSTAYGFHNSVKCLAFCGDEMRALILSCKWILCRTRPNLHKLVPKHLTLFFHTISYCTVCSWVFFLFFSVFVASFSAWQVWTMFSSTISPWWSTVAPLHLAIHYVYSFHWLLFAIRTKAVKNFMDWLKSIFLPSIVPTTLNVEIDWIITWKYNQKQYFQQS